MATPTKRNALAHFQRWSSRYERSWLQSRYFRPAQQKVLEVIGQHISTPPGAVLDVGCGTGRLLRSIHERWPDAVLTGVDPAGGMIEMACELAPYATFKPGFAEELPLPDASIDVITSTFSFHHWSDQVAGLREVVRVLRPEGYFFLADAMVSGWLARFLPVERFRRPAQVQSLFEQVGLHVLDQQFAVYDWVLITVGRRRES